jgi:2-polyprenyl-3-methyl-5-hydroxy-6-metoxy-1,4-benzoquinol methylase
MLLNGLVCPNPIFIIGSPRSGTTILAWSLAQHSQLWTSEESDILFDLLGWGHVDKAFNTARARPGGIDWLKVNGVDRAEFLGYLGLGLNALVTSRSQNERWIDQTPRNTLLLDVLVDMFPGAYFLHMLRDGRRVVQSMLHFFDPLGEKLTNEFITSGRMPVWATDFHAACKEWAKFVETSMAFCARYPARCLTIRNETLAADAEHGFREILKFIEAPYEEGPGQFFRSNRLNSSFAQKGARHGEPDDRSADPWCGWDEERRRVFLEVAGPVFRKCGMARDAEVGVSDYERLVVQVCEKGRSVLPLSSITLVISEGEDKFLNLGCRQAWHFPRTEEGWHGGHPADSADAVAQLAAMRAAGADFLLIPKPAFWWLDYYTDFRDYLKHTYQGIHGDDTCLIYALSQTEAQQGRHYCDKFASKMVRSRALWARLSQLSDEEWLATVIRSIRDPRFDGFDLPQVAPVEIQRKYNASVDAEANLRLAWEFYRAVKDYAGRLGRTLTPESRILDFGCGWGRVLRFFLKDVLDDRLYGVDVDPAAIEMCRQTMLYGTYTVTQRCPPTEFSSDTFDLVYAYSVFSHLSEADHIRWVEEMARILKPGGLLVATTLGRSFIEVCKTFREKGRLEQAWEKSAAESFGDWMGCLAEYDGGRFLFAPNPSPVYGMSVIPKEYVQKEWARFLEFQCFIDDRSFLPQAFIVLNKPDICEGQATRIRPHEVLGGSP